MATHTARDRFLDSLPLRAAGQSDAADRDRAFVAAVLAYGSDTDDNRLGVERIGIQPIGGGPDGTSRIGYALRGSGIPVADLLNAAEGTPLPAALAEGFGAVTQQDWDAVLRLATLIFVAFESSAEPG